MNWLNDPNGCVFYVGTYHLYSNYELAGFLRQCLGDGGAVTLNVGIYQEGHLGPQTLGQLDLLRASERLRA